MKPILLFAFVILFVTSEAAYGTRKYFTLPFDGQLHAVSEDPLGPSILLPSKMSPLIRHNNPFAGGGRWSKKKESRFSVRAYPVVRLRVQRDLEK